LMRSGSLAPSTRAYVQACLLAIAFQAVIRSLSGPKTNLLAAFLLGAVGGLLDYVRLRRAALQHAT
jgi:hypothetical protein